MWLVMANEIWGLILPGQSIALLLQSSLDIPYTAHRPWSPSGDGVISGIPVATPAEEVHSLNQPSATLPDSVGQTLNRVKRGVWGQEDSVVKV